MMAKKITGPMQGPAPVYRVRDPKPLAGQAKAKQTRAAAVAGAGRESYESSSKPSPSVGATPAVSGQQRMARPGVMSGPLSPATVYKEMGWHDNSRHSAGQQALPGMGSLAEGRRDGLVSSTGGGTALPDTVPVARWHHLSNGEKMATEAHAARFGVTRASAKAAFSANLDQAYSNSNGAPHARDFYTDQSPHMPAGHIVAAAKESGRTVSAVATATAITSPQTEWGPTAEGHYPNIRAARQAAIHVGPPSVLQHPTVSDDSSKKIGTFTGNVRKAVVAVRQEDEQGVLARDLRGAPSQANPTGSGLFGGGGQQKTTAFRNALVDPEGPESSFVSDVHSGGRGMAPHLTPTDAGNYLKHPGIHQFHDHIAREVMQERGMQSINNTQAAQWGQAQLDSDPKRVNTPKAAAPAGEVHGQADLFGGETVSNSRASGHAAAAAHVAAAEHEPWTHVDQYKQDARQKSMRKGQPGLAARTAGNDPNHRTESGW